MGVRYGMCVEPVEREGERSSVTGKGGRKRGERGAVLVVGLPGRRHRRERLERAPLEVEVAPEGGGQPFERVNSSTAKASCMFVRGPKTWMSGKHLLAHLELEVRPNVEVDAHDPVRRVALEVLDGGLEAARRVAFDLAPTRASAENREEYRRNAGLPVGVASRFPEGTLDASLDVRNRAVTLARFPSYCRHVEDPLDPVLAERARARHEDRGRRHLDRRTGFNHAGAQLVEDRVLDVALSTARGPRLYSIVFMPSMLNGELVPLERIKTVMDLRRACRTPSS